MDFALDQQGNRVYAEEADKSQEYTCPVCGGKVIPRQGDVNRDHFAHESACEDTWSYDMSDWHRGWQEQFPRENREVVVKFKGERHRADVLIGKYVIEFQHSPISAGEVKRRNEFYSRAGYKVVWVFDVTAAFDNEKIDNPNEKWPERYYWKHPSQVASLIQPQTDKKVAVIFQFTEGNREEGYDPWLVMVDWAKPDGPDGADYSFFIIDDFFEPDLFTEEGLSDIFLGKKKRRFEAFRKRNEPWSLKCGRMKGYPRQCYVCEKTGQWHNGSCEACPHSLIREFRRGTEKERGGVYYYCCYPRVMHDIGHSELPDHERTPSIRI